MCSPHILAIPFPAQGHVIPLLELSQCLVKHGYKVTFVNTDYNHKRVVNAMEENSCMGDQIQLVSISDGMEPWEDKNQLGKLSESMLRTMPGKLQELIEKINREGDKIACVIGDGNTGWVMEVAKKLNIRRAAFWPAAMALLALSFSIPKLIDDGIINNDETLIKKEKKAIFDLMVDNNENLKMAEIRVCNSTYDLEPTAFGLVPDILPVGPLLASNRLGNSAGNFWPEDQTCLKWLDQQPLNSVIYVAFGSFTVFDHIQFNELALGLELSNRPFLWVVRLDFSSDTDDAYLEGFENRVATRGRMVLAMDYLSCAGHTLQTNSSMRATFVIFGRSVPSSGRWLICGLLKIRAVAVSKASNNRMSLTSLLADWNAYATVVSQDADRSSSGINLESLLADWNAYATAVSQDADRSSSEFDLKAAVRTTTDTFNVVTK
ncbi:hypothetical protein JRO89_XS12G0225500 [Xanthoceras sorbifolium]|uniref:UDP-glycosyltransferase 83A1-like n=1 Tax=Xanthoceras sorbifolium TaxID=99658 RepID=A0ABQ8HDC3_9ROSI|nr:hypothetical protein JRO89_XS12G0225500 [Xanthoceras sorbifolium]